VGKSNKPLNIALSGTLWNLPGLSDLGLKGHDITVLGALSEYDIVWGPNCRVMTPELWKYHEAAIKAARLIKYGKKE
jgi:hypothetical protein